MERHSILLVEDDEAFANFLTRELKDAGHEVESVKNADQGVIRATEKKFDAVVTDLQLPGRVGLELMGGLRLVTELHRLAPHLPIIVMTGFHTTDVAIEAIKLGAYDYLIKPDVLRTDAFEGEFLCFARELLALIDDAVRTSRPAPCSEAPDERVEGGEGLIGRSRAMQNLCKEIGRLARTHVPILIVGEAGTGKELVARTIHQHSHYADAPFIVVNCLGVSESSLLSELLDLEKEILEARRTGGLGVVSQARSGTVFLREVSELPSAVLQVLARLARLSSVYHGDAPAAKPAVRVLTATHSDPKTLWQKWPSNSALQGLLNALGRATIRVPPLRDRCDDVPALVRYFMKRFGAEQGITHPAMSGEAIECLQRYNWPGNLTELQQVVSLLLVRSRGPTLRRETVAAVLDESASPGSSPSQPVSHVTEVNSKNPAHQLLLDIARNVESLLQQPTESPFPHIPDYESIRQIGRGAYGEVWLVRTITGGYRAVKIISRSRLPDARAFEQEFSALKRIEAISQKLDGFVRILHIGRNDRSGYYYYVMELADDQTSSRIGNPQTYAPRTLAGEIRKRGALPLGECLQIGISLATTLEHLHAQGLVHRDIKPSNIIFVEGAPKVGDIGLVTDVGGETYCGTQGYIPPERPGRPSADVYSLGKVIYEMMTGMDRMKFPEVPTYSPPSVLRILPFLLRACDEENKRYQSAGDLRDALATFKEGAPL